MGGGPRGRPQHDVRRQDEPEAPSPEDADPVRVVGQRSSAVMDHSPEPGETSGCSEGGSCGVQIL